MTTVWIDRDGDVWHATGRDANGDQLVACDHPHDSTDQGVGPSFPWTLPTISSRFGPLTTIPDPLAAEFADLEQDALAEADRHFGNIHGTPDQWSEPEWATYEHLLDRVRGMFHTDPAVA